MKPAENDQEVRNTADSGAKKPRPPAPEDEFLGIKTGVVKSFNEYAKPGFGHILDSNNHEHFVHFSEIRGSGYKNICRGQHVRFSSWLGRKGLYAKDVTVITVGE